MRQRYHMHGGYVLHRLGGTSNLRLDSSRPDYNSPQLDSNRWPGQWWWVPLCPHLPHVRHHWPPLKVLEEVTALGFALGAGREPLCTGDAAVVGGGCSTGGAPGDWARVVGLWRAMRWPPPC